MADTKADSPWPLVAVAAFPDDQMEKFDKSEEEALTSLMEIARAAALKMLRDVNRAYDVQAIKIYCYDHDITKEKE